MFMDEHLTFERADRDTPATLTKALPMGQGDFVGINPPDTAGMGPYGGLYLVVTAAEDIAAGYSIVITHSDTETGTYTDLLASAATAFAAVPGNTLFKIPVPFDIKNWVKIRKETTAKVNIWMTNDVDKWIPNIAHV